MIPAISVIVPVYNRPHLVVRSLDSIFNQAESLSVDMQIVVVDNASTDATPEVLREWQARHVNKSIDIAIASEPRKGASRARKTGASIATAPIICFFDSDDIMPSGTLKAYLDAFANNPDADIVAATARIVATNGAYRSLLHRGGDDLINHLHHCTLRSASYAVKRDYYDSCGGWNPRVGIWDDWELGMRLLLRSPKMVKIQHCAVDIYPNEESITGPCYSSRPYSAYDIALSAAEEAIYKSNHRQSRRLLKLLLYRRMMLSGLFAKEDDYVGSREIETDVLRRIAELSRRPKALAMLLRFSRFWTACGLRGAASIVTPLIR